MWFSTRPRALFAMAAAVLLLAGCGQAPVRDAGTAAPPGGGVPAPSPAADGVKAPAAGAPRPATPRPERAEEPAPARAPAHADGGSRSGAAAAQELIARAGQRFSAGDLAGAEQILERALRIDPNHPVLWSNLATLRLEQGRPAEAVELYRKSNRLAGAERRLERYNWQMMAAALDRLGQAGAAREARARAGSLAR